MVPFTSYLVDLVADETRFGTEPVPLSSLFNFFIIFLRFFSKKKKNKDKKRKRDNEEDKPDVVGMSPGRLHKENKIIIINK